MKHVIIGTAGHVDHGKTCLIKALTGTDTDRLKEEKKRGITIELGFACLKLSGGSQAGIVDVPGHEKFVKNMLAGAGGMDLVMLVIAADEGVMPQTIEHLDILSILGVKKGVIVITKTDLADSELLELVKEETRELVRGTFLENAPVVPVSVRENKGVDELKEVLEKMTRELPERKMRSDFRLPIDRVFTLKGIGTIVTGTLAEGRIKKEQEAVLYPQNLPVKLRGIQVHEKAEDAAWPGQRAAVNLTGLKKEEIRRGDVLAPPNTLYPTRLIDVRVEVLRHTNRIIKQASRVHIHYGARELLGKVILMEKEELRAGESGYAQLRLEEEAVVKKGDCFVLRFYSPTETIGGGVVLDACPVKHRRRDEKVLNAFRIKERGTIEQRLELSIREHQGRFFSLEELCQRSNLEEHEGENAARKLEKEEKVVCLSDKIYVHREELALYRKKAEEFLEEFHKAYPLKEGMGLEEFRSRFDLPSSHLSDRILEILIKENILKEKNGKVSRAGFKVVVGEEKGAILQEIVRDYLDAGYTLPATELYQAAHSGQKDFLAVFHALLNKKTLIRLNEQYCVHRTLYEKAKEVFAKMAENGNAVATGEFRDCLGCSRKIAIALLEHFDKNGFTAKMDGGRILKGKS